MNYDQHSHLNHLIESYHAEGQIPPINGNEFPNPARVKLIIHEIQQLLFPGYFDTEEFTAENERDLTNIRLHRLESNLIKAVQKSVDNPAECGSRPTHSAAEVVEEFIAFIPRLRDTLRTDIEALESGDPAAKSTLEVVLSYPGFLAILIYRTAHYFYCKKVPLLPRMMTEYAHSITGIDIHPGAQIGDYFFIDHGTGIVIGETTQIGPHVKLYQGVTLGALSVDKSECTEKRHPTIEANVVVYAGATILGGDTHIGAGSIIGGNVWITRSVPTGSKIFLNNSGEQVMRKSANDDYSRHNSRYKKK